MKDGEMDGLMDPVIKDGEMDYGINYGLIVDYVIKGLIDKWSNWTNELRNCQVGADEPTLTWLMDESE